MKEWLRKHHYVRSLVFLHLKTSAVSIGVTSAELGRGECCLGRPLALTASTR
jgi:hypothetical protein